MRADDRFEILSGRGSRKAFVFVVAAALAACSGSTGPGDAPAPPPVPTGDGSPLPAGRPSGGGHWWLAALGPGQKTLAPGFCLVTEVGDFACVLSDGDGEWAPGGAGAMQGTLRVTNPDQISGSGVLYAAPGHVLSDGTSVAADFDVTGGSLSDRNRKLDLTINVLGQELTLSAAFDHYYLHAVSPAEVAKVYRSFSVFGEPASLSIDLDLALQLQSASGCVGDGKLTVINPRLNSFRVELTISNCAGREGSYQGLATVIDFEWVNGATNLLVTAFDGTNFIVGMAVQ